MLLARAAGYAQFGAPIIISDHLTRSLDPVIGDLDGDGDQDVLTESASDSLLLWYVNDGLGQFADSIHISHLPIYDVSGAIIHQLELLDLDQDGDQDIIQCLVLNGEVNWYENDGTGHFGPRTPLLTIGSWTLLGGLADFDADGIMDIPLQRLHHLAWLRNTGSVSFELVDVDMAAAGQTITADLDGDIDPDLIYTVADDFGGLSLHWSPNDGAGGFMAASFVDFIMGGNCLQAADIDGDNDADVMVGLCWGSYQGVLTYLNDGNGNFSQGGTVMPTECIPDLRMHDLDQDGDPDLLTHNQQHTLFLPNDGTGTFGAPVVVSEFDPPDPCWATCVEVADMDGDGLWDVVDSHHAAPGTYTPIQWYGSPCTPQAIIMRSGLSFSLVPNPMDGWTRAVFSSPLSPQAFVELVDVNGRVVRHGSASGAREVLIERGGSERGLYVVRVTDPGAPPRTARLVVE